ncbi:DNA cytosine methyltransferase [Luteimonas sp. SDU101]|uniref:DNA cytosine methyltransferase n=1 Tax=Luteimonas sp. SDU101 TaxID=3422593 RepID=UPI003EBB9944
MSLMLNGRKKKASAAPALGGTVHKVVGLFAGIGGVERGLGRSGHETLLFCENDPAAMAVLSHRFPGISHHDDVRTLRALPEDTTLVVAGFPCQDLSQAGTTKGLAGSRSGLVGEVFRLIEAHRTPWLLLENVPFMLQLGRGEAMNVITERLEDLGYRWAYRVVDSRAFGLPQRRRRIYLVASLEGDPRQVLFADEAGARSEPELNGHPVACGFYWTEGLRGLGWAVDAVPTLKGGSTIGIPSPPAIWMPDGRVVTPDIRDAERLQGFTPGWTSAAERVAKKGARWKLVGNAVSVPAAAWIGRRMRKPGHLADFETFPLHDNRRWPVAAWNVGEGRVGTVASEWPLERPTPSLEAFLKHAPSLLSARATGGFLGRARQARLRFPKGFLAAIEKHLDRVAQ